MAIRKRWAFLVGINRYTDYGSLSYCVDDVLALESLLKAADYRVTCLHDRPDKPNADSRPNRLYPTVDNIRAEFEHLCATIRAGANQGADDLLLVYFACHGASHTDGQPRLVATDTRKTLLAERAISITELEQGMDSSGAGCKILMLDACHIGLGKSKARAPEDPELLRKIHDRAKGYALLAASTDQQDAHEWDGVKHGVFSYYALSGLSGKADLHGKNYVTVGDLSGHILTNLQDWIARHGVKQIPQGRTEGNLGDFILIDNYQRLQQSISASNVEIESGQSSQRIQSRGCSSKQLIEALWSLDCDAQCQAFDVGTSYPCQAAAFVVQAKDSLIQYWLTKRLSHQIPDHDSAMVFPLIMPAYPMWRRGDLKDLWIELAKTLRCQPDPATVIDNLVEIYRTKSVIIKLYGWSSMPRSQTLQQQVLSEMWQPLVEAVEILDNPPLRSRIILFLAEKPPELTTVSTANALFPSEPNVPIRLEPLTEITTTHIAKWMASKEVYPALSSLIPSEQLGTFVANEVEQWNKEPSAVIEEIVYTFELEHGIADIEAEWRRPR